MADDNDDSIFDSFDVFNSSESIVSTLENEGTNASRFAVLGSMNIGIHNSFFGLNEEMGRLGFGQATISRAKQLSENGRSDDDRMRGIAALRQYEEWWNRIDTDLGDMRNRAWRAIDRGHIEARVALLTAGLCSGLERESAVAAAALIGNIRVAIAGNPRRSSAVRRFWLELYESDVDHAVWPHDLWPYLGLREGADFETHDSVPPDRIPWNRDHWATLTKLIFQSANRRFGYEYSLLHVLSDVAWIRIKLAERSFDSIVRQFPQALFLQRWRTGHRGAVANVPTHSHASRLDVHHTSTLVHGTFARYLPDKWWDRKSPFDNYQASKYRTCINQDEDRFVWNSHYSERSRKRAGRDFRNWISTPASREALCTVYAHSCGAEVVAHAVNGGSRISELVLLSAPVNEYLEVAIPKIGRVYDVRLGFDIVLLLSQMAQSLLGFDEHQFPSQISKDHSYRYIGVKNLWSHGATHSEVFWDRENIAQEIHL